MSPCSGVPGRLAIDISRLRERAGKKRRYRLTGVVEGAELSGAELDGSEVAADVELESVLGGVAVRGIVNGRWRGRCRRCLAEIEADVEVEVDELFTDDPVEGETYPIRSGVIDLSDMVRDALVLAVPLAPLCSEECPGPDPERYPTGSADQVTDAPRDGRWAVLDDLTF